MLPISAAEIRSGTINIFRRRPISEESGEILRSAREGARGGVFFVSKKEKI